MGAGTTTVPLGARRGRGDAGSEGARLVRRVSRRVGLSQLLASFWGAVDVFLLLWWVLPTPGSYAADGSLLVNAAAFAVFLPLMGLVGWRLGQRLFTPVEAWLDAGRAPTEAERADALTIPLRCAAINAAGWTAGAALFFLINLSVSIDAACHVGSTILLGGLTCVALGYLLCERTLRPITARALAGPALRTKGPGVAGRLVLTWAFATGVPIVGLAMLGLHVLIDPADTTVRQIAVAMVVLAVVAAVVGLGGMVLAARSVADPLTALRRALATIEAGDLSARVEVDDGSEVGQLQSGFNRMATGLREREQLRDLFGRHVGEDVARRALDDDGLRLGGEVRDVAVLFVDLIGSTSLAARRPPRDVVRLLNDFFAVVVEVVGRHGGWVNKFEGDGALAVFGAPVDHPDAPGAALAAARELRRRLHVLPGVDAGIGVSAGPAVAGNVGAEQRFEYTVIGDPVNEAARLCDLAKRRDERLLASHPAVERCANGERDRWTRSEDVVLRGRRHATAIAVPTGATAARC